MEEDGYCKTDLTMLKSMDVLEKGELKKYRVIDNIIFEIVQLM